MMRAAVRTTWLLLACAAATPPGQARPLMEKESTMHSPLSASQPSPPVVPALEREGVRYEQDVERQRRDDALRAGWLVARDAATGRQLWEAEIYANPSDPTSPMDSPVVWFSSMAFVDGARALTIASTAGGRYEVDLRTHAVKQTGGPSTRTPEARPDNRPGFD